MSWAKSIVLARRHRYEQVIVKLTQCIPFSGIHPVNIGSRELKKKKEEERGKGERTLKAQGFSIITAVFSSRLEIILYFFFKGENFTRKKNIQKLTVFLTF